MGELAPGQSLDEALAGTAWGEGGGSCMDRLQLRGCSGATLCRSGGASHLLQLDLHVSPLPCCGPDSLPCRHLPILCTTHHRRRQPRRAHRSPVCGRPCCAAARAVSAGAGAHERPRRRGHGGRPGEAQLRGRVQSEEEVGWKSVIESLIDFGWMGNVARSIQYAPPCAHAIA